MYAAESEDGGFVILELLGHGEPQIGDVLSHKDFALLGAAPYRNLTQNLTISVFVQNFVGTLEQAKKHWFLS
jgi:hypothetical protein